MSEYGRRSGSITLILLAVGTGYAYAEPSRGIPGEATTEPTESDGLGASGDGEDWDLAEGPIRWMPSRGRQCHRKKRRRSCEGPRRVPQPHGRAAVLASTLGIGTRQAVTQVLTSPPDPRWVSEAPKDASDTLLWPVEQGQYRRGFGYVRKHKRDLLHKGVDISARQGSKIRAVDHGLVIYSDNNVSGYGNLVALVHSDGAVTFYAHCRSTYVFAGQRVKRGQVIGEVGATGLAKGPHLHFEWRVNGVPADPMPHFSTDTDDTEPTPVGFVETRTPAFGSLGPTFTAPIVNAGTQRPNYATNLLRNSPRPLAR